MTDKKYDAFISYRHTELDKFVAINLHKKLESFKLPKGVTSSTGKKKIERVFRDQDELPLSSDLSAQINDALIVSDFLIVICTPRLPESEWCKREIETFIKLHGRDKILAVLAEGEPWESFPEALTKEEVEVTKPDGTKEIELHSVEPLAADVRGKSNREIKKKLDDAVLRIAAAIFDLGYDDLKQRHKERKMKRTISAISGVAAGLLLFSAVCLAMTFKIMVQSEMILDQNNEIKEQSNRISLMAQELEIKNQDLTEQYRETHINYAKATADSADSLMHKGRRLDALYALRQVMPSAMDDESMPYTAETQLALTNALEVYYDNSAYSTGLVYESDSNILSFDVSSDYKYLAVIDTAKIIRVYDIESGKMLYTENASTPRFGTSSRIMGFIDSETILFSASECLVAHNIPNNTDEFIQTSSSGDTVSANIVPFKEDNIFFAYDSGSIYIYNSDNLSLLYEYAYSDLPELDSGWYSVGFIKMSPNKESLLFTIDTPNDNTAFYRIRLSDGDVRLMNTLESGRDFFSNGIQEIYVTDDCYYVSVMITDLSNLLTADYQILCYDLYSGNMEWKTSLSSNARLMHKNEDGKNLFAASKNTLFVLDSASGELIDSFSDSAEILYLQKGSFNGDYVDFITTDSVIKSYMGNSGLWRFSIFDTFPDYEIDSLYLIENGLLIQPKNNNYIASYFKKTIDDIDEAQTLPIINEDCKEINKAGDLCLTIPTGSNTAEIYDTATGEVAYKYTSSNKNFSLVGDGKNCIVAFEQGFEVFDFVSGKAVCAAPGTYYFGPYSVSCDKEYIIGINNDECAVFSLLTGDKEATFKLDEDIDASSIILINKDTYAVSEYGQKLKFYKTGDPKPCLESAISLSIEDSIVKCEYDDILCVSYKNCSFEVYSADDSVKLLKSFYKMDNQFLNDSSMVYYPGKDIYVLSDASVYNSTYVFDSECNLIAHIPVAVFFFEDKSLFVYRGSIYDYSSPFYSYEELIKMADEALGDYHPSQRIAAQFNIK